jgi:hypothetical protein
VYDRISAPVQKFLESLTATYAQPKFNEAAKKNGFKVYSEPRGAPENVGEVLEAVHPVVSRLLTTYHVDYHPYRVFPFVSS